MQTNACAYAEVNDATVKAELARPICAPAALSRPFFRAWGLMEFVAPSRLFLTILAKIRVKYQHDDK
jgi:hypothetical protein